MKSFRILHMATIVALFFIACCPMTVSAQTIHVILASENTPGFEATDQQADIENMQRLFRTNVPEDRLNLVLLPLGESKPASILETIAALETGSSDAVVVYYSGLGRENPQEPGKLGRREIRDALNRKSPRLSVLLTDCCNLGVPADYLGPSPRPDKAPGVVSPLFDSLFLKSEGHVDIATQRPVDCNCPCDQRERSPERGSCFTVSLVEYLAMNKATPELAWQNVVDGVGQKLDKSFCGTCVQNCPNSSEPCLRVFELPDGTQQETQRGGGRQRQRQQARLRLGMRAMQSGGVGLRVTEVVEGSPAEKLRLAVGDEILEIDGQAISSESDYARAIDASSGTLRITTKNATTGEITTENVKLGQ